MSETITKIKQVLAGHPDVRLAIVFGSVAAGKERYDSDLDLAVDTCKQMTVNKKMDLIAELALATGRPVDLADLQTAGEPLLGQILRHGKRILGEDTHYAALISRRLVNQADFVPYRNRILTERRRAWLGK
ncbi:MAG: nucleotidyltransferase domain-containing protein [Gammaproteobacteria bacterium]|nr:nucleotidyltransferase domain-containing protein [Gammaproteobacteria bacterium]